MKVYLVKVPIMAVEAPDSQKAVLGVINRIIKGKIQLSVTELPRHILHKKTGPGPAPPGTWWPMGKMAQIMCPNGHAVALVSEVHTIRDNGEVSPSVVCGYLGCGFHVHVQLERWGP